MTTEEAMERMTTKEAARLLNMDVLTLQYMMKKERLPIGYAFKKEGGARTTFIIYRGLLEQYMQKIAGEKDETVGN